MSVVATGAGHFQIPSAPAAGASVTSGAANALTGTAIVLSASTSAIYITGVHVEQAAASAATYTLVQLCQGASGAETSIGQFLVPLSTGSTVALGFRPIFPPLKVAASTRLSVKTADSVGAKASLVTVEAVLQSNVADDGITVGTVNLVNTLTTYTGNTPQTGDAFTVVKAGGTGDNAAIKAKTDNLPAIPASTTNITAVGSVTGNVGGSVASVTAGVTVATNNDKTGYSLTQSFPANFASLGISVAGHIANVDTLTTYTGDTPQTGDSFARIGVAGAGLTALGDTRLANLDATVSSRFAASSYTAPDNASIATILTDVNTGAGAIFSRLGAPAGVSLAADLAAVKLDSGAIKAKTDGLTFTTANVVDANLHYVNNALVRGTGVTGNEWGPA